MSFYIASAIINALTSLFLASLIIAIDYRHRINIYFGLFFLSVFFWSLAYSFWMLSENYFMALFWVKLLSACALFIPLLFLFFTQEYLHLNYNRSHRILKRGLIVICIFLIYLIFNSDIIYGLHARLDFDYWPQAGKWYIIYLIYFFLPVAYSLYSYSQAIKFGQGRRRQQMLILAWGTGIGFIGGSTNFFIWYDVPIPPFGNILVSLYGFLLLIKYIQLFFKKSEIPA